MDEHRSKYLCLVDSGADATSECEIFTTKPTSKDGMSLPLPWCVDRIGAIASNDNNGHEPQPISVTAQTNFNWEPSHSSSMTNLPRNVSVHESVSVSFPNPPLQCSASFGTISCIAKTTYNISNKGYCK